MPQNVIGEQPPDLVTSETSPAPVARWNRRSNPVGVRVVRDRQTGANPLGERHHEIHRPRLLRVRERHGRERAVGFELLLDHRGRTEPTALERRDEHLAADTVHCGVGNGDRGDLGPEAHGGHRVEVGLDEIGAEVGDQRVVLAREGDVEWIDLANGGRDQLVVRGDDLRATIEVHLVAVVRWRVV